MDVFFSFSHGTDIGDINDRKTKEEYKIPWSSIGLLPLVHWVWCGLTLFSLKSFLPKGMWSALRMAAFSPGDRNSIKLPYFHVRRNISFKYVLNCSETRWLGGKGWGKGESVISVIQKKGPWQGNFLLIKVAYLCKYSYVPTIVLHLYSLSTDCGLYYVCHFSAFECCTSVELRTY